MSNNYHKEKKDSAIEKANKIYKNIKNQEKIKAEMAKKRDLY